MNFLKTHIELDSVDRWYLTGNEKEVGYDYLTELYWQAEAHFDQLVYDEIEALEAARNPPSDESGITLDEALRDPSIADPNSTFMAQKMVRLHQVLINYVDSSYLD